MSKNTTIIAIVVGLVILSIGSIFLFFNQSKVDEQTTTDAKEYSMDEIAQHKDAESCWLLVEGKVYDVTNFIPQHPGGEVILKGCGQDATELFNTKDGKGMPHSGSAHELMKDYYIGDLQS